MASKPARDQRACDKDKDADELAVRAATTELVRYAATVANLWPTYLRMIQKKQTNDATSPTTMQRSSVSSRGETCRTRTASTSPIPDIRCANISRPVVPWKRVRWIGAPRLTRSHTIIGAIFAITAV